jgi:hypothetical protein
MQEGWFGDDYFVLFSEDEALSASQRYRVGETLPDYVIIGLCNWDDFIVRDGSGNTYALPTVPIAREYQRQVAVPPGALLEPDDRFVGKLKWYVTPLVFGGDPEAGENLIWISYDQHVELVLWWNTKYQEHKSPR